MPGRPDSCHRRCAGIGSVLRSEVSIPYNLGTASQPPPLCRKRKARGRAWLKSSALRSDGPVGGGPESCIGVARTLVGCPSRENYELKWREGGDRGRGLEDGQDQLPRRTSAAVHVGGSNRSPVGRGLRPGPGANDPIQPAG